MSKKQTLLFFFAAMTTIICAFLTMLAFVAVGELWSLRPLMWGIPCGVVASIGYAITKRFDL